jgi:hypothetical protein
MEIHLTVLLSLTAVWLVAGWLDRWFEATRAILELLYVQGPGRSR